MSEAARTIRNYLDEQGGSVEANVHHLLSTFDVADNAAGREQIMRELGAVGVRSDRPLAELESDDGITLSTEDQPAGAPWDRPPADADSRAATAVVPATGARSPEADAAQRTPGRGGRRAATVALVVLLGVGAGVGGYLVGKSGGEDLDAAREAGERQGQREGAARGAERGYAAGFRKGRKAGYEQTYDKAYIRAYKKEFEEAGLAVPEKVKVP